MLSIKTFTSEFIITQNHKIQNNFKSHGLSLLKTKAFVSCQLYETKFNPLHLANAARKENSCEKKFNQFSSFSIEN